MPLHLKILLLYIFRSNLNNNNDIGKWVEEFSIKTNTRWNERTTVPNGTYIQSKYLAT